jgi:hypothetical protein
MAQTGLRTAYLLSTIIAFLAIVASAGGLLLGDLYRDNALVTVGWVGNDLVTLVVAVSVLVAALILSMRGSLRARLVWLGMLGYTLYNYAFYLFGAAFNRFLPLQGAVYMLALTAASVSAVRAGFPEAAAQIPIWGFLLVGSLVASGLLLGSLQSAQSGEKGEFR